MAEEPGTRNEGTPEDELHLGLEDPRVRAWFGEHLPELRRSASGHHVLYRTLVFGAVLGLVAHIGGYALRTAASSEPLDLVGDLIYALGYALWTGVVVVLFTQVIPEVKQRQYKEAVAAYEATMSNEQRAGPAQP